MGIARPGSFDRFCVTFEVVRAYDSANAGLGDLPRLACIMASNLKEEEVLEAALAGVSRVAEAIAAMPDERRVTALEAAERSYRKTAKELGYGVDRAERWAATMMVSLRAELEFLSHVLKGGG